MNAVLDIHASAFLPVSVWFVEVGLYVYFSCHLTCVCMSLLVLTDAVDKAAGGEEGRRD